MDLDDVILSYDDEENAQEMSRQTEALKVTGLQLRVLKLLGKMPMTLSQLTKAVNLLMDESYSKVTLRNNIYDLRDAGYIQELSFKQGHEKVWGILSREKGNQLYVPYGESRITLSTAVLGRATRPHQVLITNFYRSLELLAHLWIRAKHIEQGLAPPPPEAKDAYEYLVSIRDRFEDYVGFLNHILSATALWKDDGDVVLKVFGELDEGLTEEMMRELAVQFEHDYQGREIPDRPRKEEPVLFEYMPDRKDLTTDDEESSVQGSDE